MTTKKAPAAPAWPSKEEKFKRRERARRDREQIRDLKFRLRLKGIRV